MTTTTNPFGRMITAMCTPMHEDGSVDFDSLRRLAGYLADHGHDGLLVNGTTGESPTTTDEEDYECVRVVVDEVGDRIKVMAGCGTNDTEHSARAAREMVARGANSLLVVTPYYNKPPQPLIVEHVRTVADAGGDTPIMLYDIPGRTGTPLSEETILACAEIPQVRGLKDAKGDLYATSRILAATDLLVFSGDDVLNLPHLAQGAIGLVSVVGHVAGDRYREMIDCVDRGDLTRAREIHRELIPVIDALMATSQGAIQAKAAMKMLGVISSDALRMPYAQGPEEHRTRLRTALEGAGLFPG